MTKKKGGGRFRGTVLYCTVYAQLLGGLYGRLYCAVLVRVGKIISDLIDDPSAYTMRTREYNTKYLI